MFLCITFNYETIPFMLDMATMEECLRAIEKAKENFRFDESRCIIEPDRIILHAWSKSSGQKQLPKKRLYCLQDKVILQTDTKCEEEKEPTRNLLAYEHNVDAEKIYIVEV